MKHRAVTIKLITKTGLKILENDIPTARKIVSSESLLSLSKVNNEPSNKPTGKAFPKILGNSQTKISIPVFGEISPDKILLITFNNISGAIQTIVNKSIDIQVVNNICLKIYLS